MSTDIQIISMVDDLSVFSVEEIDGSSPRALNIKGRRGHLEYERNSALGGPNECRPCSSYLWTYGAITQSYWPTEACSASSEGSSD